MPYKLGLSLQVWGFQGKMGMFHGFDEEKRCGGMVMWATVSNILQAQTVLCDYCPKTSISI